MPFCETVFIEPPPRYPVFTVTSGRSMGDFFAQIQVNNEAKSEDGGGRRPAGACNRQHNAPVGFVFIKIVMKKRLIIRIKKQK